MIAIASIAVIVAATAAVGSLIANALKTLPRDEYLDSRDEYMTRMTGIVNYVE